MEIRPTRSEVEILGVLWNKGPSSVRDVYDKLNERKRTGYTTVLKLMQIMVEKGLVTRVEDERAHIYQAAAEQKDTQKGLVADLAERAFGGSAHRLALHALSLRKSSPEELAEIRELLKRLEDHL